MSSAAPAPDEALAGDGLDSLSLDQGLALATAEAPSEPLYHSPRGLYDFQALAVAYGYECLANLFVYDTGIGKSHIAMASAAMLFEDGKIDAVVLAAEKNKLEKDEWPRDFATFTKLTAVKYHGDKKRRTRFREEGPQVFLSTYETVRNDAVVKGTKLNAKKKPIECLEPGPLLEKLLTMRSVLFVYDEATKLGNRSPLHKAHEFILKTLRKAGVEVRVMMLTATPIERGPENHYNLGRLLQPEVMPTVAQFERDYVAKKDFFGNYAEFKNLNAEECEPGVVPFTEYMRPVLRRKRKTDPDVIEQFPSVVEEEPLYVRLGDLHQEFYDVVADLAEEQDEWGRRTFYTLLRQIAGHPLSLTLSQGAAAQTIVGEVGHAGLERMGSAKTDALVDYLKPIVLGQGAQVVVFTFFANSVLPLLRDALEAAKMDVAVNAPFLSDGDRSRNKEAFRAGQKQVFLTSDAGARGINLPEALYVVEYEMALTHANRTQRFNRIHRIDSKHPSVTFRSLIAYDTVEEGIAFKNLKRNEWSDKLLDDDDPGEDFLSSMDRKLLFKRARAKVE